MKQSGPARGPSCVRLGVLCAAVVICFFPGKARSQDVAEAARQERERKASQQQAPRHVYTGDDLKRKVILTPEDQARVEAHRKDKSIPAAEENAKEQPQEGMPQTESLGEVARRYRQQKAERQAELAAKGKFTPFPYVVPKGALAEPKSVNPKGLLSELGKNSFRPEPYSDLAASSRRGRISPFQPRPLSANHGQLEMPERSFRSGSGSEHSAPLSADIPMWQRIQVERGQCWWKLAQTYLGNGARWPELAALNGAGRTPSGFLRAGDVVVVPATEASPKAMPQTVQVRKGDSLWSLAKQHLGRGSAWTCLASANPQVVDYTHLAVGSVLRMPEVAGVASTAKSASLLRK